MLIRLCLKAGSNEPCLRASSSDHQPSVMGLHARFVSKKQCYFLFAHKTGVQDDMGGGP
jgi:hypothetical protein